MSKMENQFEYKKTAKAQSSLGNTNNVITELEAQIDKIVILSEDIQRTIQKSGHQSNERNKKTRRIVIDQDSTTKSAETKTAIHRYKANEKSQTTSPSWNNLGVKEGSSTEVWSKRGQKVRNPLGGIETACMGTRAESKKPAGRCKDSQKVSIKISMVSLEPGNKSSELVVPERRPSRVYPK